VVALQGVLRFRSQVEHARYAAARVPGVIIIRNNLTYELDDLMVTAL
jgi:osmotically-inducible protein OsmY